jgi:hypothetical protein
MRKLLATLAIILFFSTILSGTALIVRDYLYNVRVRQYLRLADDASLPAMKATYLVKYKEAVSQSIKREDARYIFTQMRLTKTVQLANLDSLIVRLRDISELQPGSMAYQQGMQQVTGQEFDHTIAEIDGVFTDCYMRDSFVGRFAVEVITVFSGILCFIAGVAWFLMWMNEF